MQENRTDIHRNGRILPDAGSVIRDIVKRWQIIVSATVSGDRYIYYWKKRMVRQRGIRKSVRSRQPYRKSERVGKKQSSGTPGV